MLNLRRYGNKSQETSQLQADPDDPVATVQEQLIQQEVRLGHVEDKLSTVDSKLQVVTTACSLIAQSCSANRLPLV